MSNPHPVDVHVGRRLRLRRSILGWSQEMVGDVVGITFQQVQKYERGVNRMGASRLFDFAKALKVEVSYFFEDFGDFATPDTAGYALGEAPAVEFEHSITNKETIEVMRAYYRIKSPALRKRVIELIKAMSDEDGEEKRKIAGKK
jgi:transcriptional regulator with XRE-family HTH domain